MTTPLTAERGVPSELGATVTEDGLHFAVYSENADEVQLCLFDEFGIRETERLRLPGRDGHVRFGFAPGLRAGTRYAWRARGPFSPQEGHRFDAQKLLVDPYARQLDRPFVYRPELAAPPSRGIDSGPFVPRAIALPATDGATSLPFAPPGFTYEMHVRGFTQRQPNVPLRLRGTVAALAEPAALDHLVALGVETVELMPLAAVLDERHLGPLGLTNAWGYNPIAHMAPDPRLCPGGMPELRRAVEALHGRGIRVLLDVVLNHSAESDESGPTICYRGLDNALYYRLGENGTYVNDTGTGNTFACDRPPVMALFRTVLRRWVEEAGIDGFRYDLGTVLARTDRGFSPSAPFLKILAGDEVLKDRIHVMEPWDIGPGGYQVGNFPPPFLEWQDRFRDDVRRFWRGDGTIGALATRVAGSADLFATAGRRPSAGVNFLAAHDGFTLADLVAFNSKHNQPNGENNRDGHNDNHSWNNGVEGRTEDAAVREARGRDVRAMLATLFVSRGNPMITAGDELGRTQNGNNNAYSQDNETLWIDWQHADRELIAFVARLQRLRREHPALSADAFLHGEALDATGRRDVEWLNADGTAMGPGDWAAPGRRFLALSFFSPGLDGSGEHALVYLNGGSEEVLATPPPPPAGQRLVLELRSDRPDADPVPVEPSRPLPIAPRSVFVVVESEAL